MTLVLLFGGWNYQFTDYGLFGVVGPGCYGRLVAKFQRQNIRVLALYRTNLNWPLLSYNIRNKVEMWNFDYFWNGCFVNSKQVMLDLVKGVSYFAR